MGFQKVVWGYIELPPGLEAAANATISRFPFARQFQNVFGNCTPGFRSSMIPFAVSVSRDNFDQHDWLASFERLLGHLAAIAARIDLYNSDSDGWTTIDYVCLEPERKGKPIKWRKWHYSPDQALAADFEQDILLGADSEINGG